MEITSVLFYLLFGHVKEADRCMFSRVAVQAAKSQGITLRLGVEGEGGSQKTVTGPGSATYKEPAKTNSLTVKKPSYACRNLQQIHSPGNFHVGYKNVEEKEEKNH